MKKIAGIILCSATLLCTCGEKAEKFEVNGHISSADDKTVYFEAVTLEGINILDSAKLKSDGAFRFRGARPFNPEFYRLRVDRQTINLSIDSTETVRVEADLPTMATDYRVEGSPNCETIKDLSIKQIQLQKQIENIYTDRSLMLGEQERLANELIDRYKAHIKTEYILKDPASAYAYFALFQTIGNVRIFNLTDDPADIRFAGSRGHGVGSELSGHHTHGKLAQHSHPRYEEYQTSRNILAGRRGRIQNIHDRYHRHQPARPARQEPATIGCAQQSGSPGFHGLFPPPLAGTHHAAPAIVQPVCRTKVLKSIRYLSTPMSTIGKQPANICRGFVSTKNGEKHRTI